MQYQYAIEMMVAFTQMDYLDVVSMAINLLPNEATADMCFKVLDLATAEFDAVKDRGNYSYVVTYNLDRKPKAQLICPHYGSCLYELGFRDLLSLSCIIVPYQLLPKVMLEIGSERRSLLQQLNRIANSPKHAKRGTNLRRKLSKRVILAFDESNEKETWESFSSAVSFEELASWRCTLKQIIPSGKYEKKLAKELFFAVDASNARVEVHNAKTMRVALFLDNHDHLIFHAIPAGRKLRPNLFGRGNLQFLFHRDTGNPIYQKLIVSCATTPLPVMYKMFPFAKPDEWVISQPQSAAADNPPNPVVFVSTLSWSRRSFEMGALLFAIGNILNTALDRSGGSAYIATKKDYENEIIDILSNRCFSSHFGNARGFNDYMHEDIQIIAVVGIYHFDLITQFVYEQQGLSPADIDGLERSEVLQDLHRARPHFRPEAPIIVFGDAATFSVECRARAQYVELSLLKTRANGFFKRLFQNRGQVPLVATCVISP
jgi:hypothetical protein